MSTGGWVGGRAGRPAGMLCSASLLYLPCSPTILRPVCRIPAGAASVEVEDWDSGALLTLALDPQKTAVEFAEGIYKQVRQG